MDYNQTLEWLMGKLPMFQRTGVKAFKADLHNIRKLTEGLGNPQNAYKTIHVAGTNGKGSTCHMLASVLQEAGYKTGLTTSPHFRDFRERMRVNGEMCPREFVVEFVEQNKELIESLRASFFEVSTAMSFKYFEEEKVDIAVIETGLGGRLDSTNIITPVLSVITNIGKDHTAILGDTLEEIAFQKAGIIKTGVPAVIGESNSETRPVFQKKAMETGSQIIFAEDNKLADKESDLKGIYQIKNRQTVLNVIEQLRNIGFEISDRAIEEGLKNVQKNTGLHGRWEILGKDPLTIADTAHNPHGLKEVRKQIDTVKYQKLHLVLGFVNDKDVLGILEFFPKDAKYYFSEPDVPRKFLIEELKKIIPNELDAQYFPTVQEALKAAKDSAAPEDFIYVGGSTFVVAEVV